MTKCAEFLAWSWALILLLCMGTSVNAETSTQSAHRDKPFIIGADISWVQEDEANGSTYFDNGRREDIFKILKDHGFNAIRLRVFVNPSSDRGYANKSKEAFCDLAHTLVMAKRAHDAGMRLLIDFHYSDNWADPGHQVKPLAWEKLDLDGLKKAVGDHTHDVLKALKEQGTGPEMVQIGNEVTRGMLWPEGRAPENFDAFAELVKAGIAAAREVDPSIKIVMHHHSATNLQSVHTWVDGLIARGVQFDILGLSCNSKAKPAVWKKTFDDLAEHYPQYGLIAAEYSYEKRELNDIVFNAPDKRGLGTFIWEPTRHHEAIFDQNGVNAGSAPAPTTTPGHRPRKGRFDANQLIDLYRGMVADYAK